MKTTKLAAAIAAVMFGMIATGTAQATPDASAESVVTLQNFTISQGGTELARSNFGSIFSPFGSESVKADLNGVVSAPGDVNSTTGGPLSNTAQVGTAPAALTGVFGLGGYPPGTAYPSIYPLPMGTNFSGSLSSSIGAPITGLSGNPTDAKAMVNNASYASLVSNGSASTNTTSTVTSKFNFSGISGVMNFHFDFGAFIDAYLSSGFGTVAKASYGLQMQLVDLSGIGQPGVLDTTTGKVGGVATTAIFDANGNLVIAHNLSDSTPGLGTNLQNPFPFTNASNNGLLSTVGIDFNTLGLNQTDIYQFTATVTTNSEVQLVPEPGILALMGIGLMGLGASSRKFQKSAHVTA